MIGKTGFEPATSTSGTWRSTKLSHFPDLERKTGLEPATPTWGRWCSTTELLPHNQELHQPLILIRLINKNVNILLRQKLQKTIEHLIVAFHDNRHRKCYTIT